LKPTIATFLGVLLTLPFSSVHTEPATVLDRDTAIQQALQQNRDLRVASLQIQRAKVRLHWAGRLPNPEIELTAEDDFLGENEDENSLGLAYTQRFPIGSSLRLDQELRRSQVTMAELEFVARQRQLAYEVELAWVKLAVSAKKTNLQSRLLQLNADVVQFLDDKAGVGEASPLDATQAKLSGRMIDQKLAFSKRDAQSAEARLELLIGLNPAASIVVPTPALPAASPSRGPAIGSVLQRRADYLALVHQAAVGKASLDLATAQKWEDIGLTVFYKREHSVDLPEGRDRNSFAGFGISLPLPLRSANGPAMADAELDIVLSDTAREALAYKIGGELRAAVESRNVAHRLAQEATGDLLELAKSNFADIQRASQSGQVGFLQVQLAQEQLLQIETTAINLLEAFLVADAEVRFHASEYELSLPTIASGKRPVSHSPQK